MSEVSKLFSASLETSSAFFRSSLMMATEEPSQQVDSFSNSRERDSLTIDLKRFILVIDNGENFHRSMSDVLDLQERMVVG